jgi:uncharacterized damage-inducible protein DinB
MTITHSEPSHSTDAASAADTGSQERADLLDVLHKHRGLFLRTVAGLSEEQARRRPTVSELSLGGLVKHVTACELEWAAFITVGRASSPDIDWANVDWSNPPPEVQRYADGFRMLEGETLAGLVEAYGAAAAATDELVRTVDLDGMQLLPEAPWFAPGASWSARRVFAHVLAETAQHAGHADILRETIDGQKSMG